MDGLSSFVLLLHFDNIAPLTACEKASDDFSKLRHQRTAGVSTCKFDMGRRRTFAAAK